MMPGFLGGAQNAQPKQPFGPQLKQGLITAAPMFNAMAAGYASGRGPYAYMDQGAALMQQNLKAKRDEEAAAAAAAAFAGLVPGGMGAAGMSSKGGASSGGGFAPVPIDPSSPDAIAADTMTALGRGNDWLKYSNQGATRNDPLDAKLVDAMSFLPQMGITMDVISGGQEAAGEGGARKGSVRHDHGMAADVDFYKDGRKLDWNNPADLPLLTQIVQTAKSRGVTGIGAGDDYMGAGRFHVGFGNPAVWGKGGQSANAPAWLVDAYNGAPSGSVTMSAKGEGSAPGVVDPLADPYIQKLMQVMAMPGLTPEQRSVVELQLQTRMGMLTAATKADTLPAGFRELDLQAQAGGLVPGTPEYQNFMLSGGAGATGGEGPAAFQALHMQALAAGFPEGSPEYKEFMATRGAGLAAESKAIGEAKGSAIAGAPAEVAAADETLGFIDEVRNHPGLDAGTGMSSMFNAVPGTSGYDFQNRVNQLLSGGFLTAIDQLRGMGALSNAEGQTATRAISRMDTATSKEEFLAALDDYERVVKAGRERAAGKLTEAPPSGAVPAPSTNDLGLSDDDLQYLGQP